MASGVSPTLVSQASRVLITGVIIGVALVGLFRLIYPEVQVTEVVTVIGLVSFLIAVALNTLWNDLRKGRGSNERER